MAMTSEQKMKKKLQWIDTSDSTQMERLTIYLDKCNWFDTTDCSFSPEACVKKFIEEAIGWNPKSEIVNLRCRRLKAAWTSWQRRRKNKDNPKVAEGSYTISKKARKELERLAKKGKCSFSQAIENLLIQNQQLKKSAQSDNRQPIRSFAEEVGTIQQIDTTQDLQKEISHLEKQIGQLNEENNKLKEKVARLEHDTLLPEANLNGHNIQQSKPTVSPEGQSETSHDVRKSPQLAKIGDTFKPGYTRQK